MSEACIPFGYVRGISPVFLIVVDRPLPHPEGSLLTAGLSSCDVLSEDRGARRTSRPLPALRVLRLCYFIPV